MPTPAPRLRRSVLPTISPEQEISGSIHSRIQSDNGLELISMSLEKQAYDHGVRMYFSRPGKPTDNPFIESFHGSLRDECLNVH
jgi:hypothetical protein